MSFKNLICCDCLISINQNLYSSSSDPYLEALPTQAKWKRTVLRRLWNWKRAPFGRCLKSIGSPFQVVGPTREKERICTVAERMNGTTKFV